MRDPHSLALEKAEWHIGLDQFDAAFEQVRIALSISPDSVAALRVLSRILMLTGNFDDAVDVCERAIVLSPEDPYGWRLLSSAASHIENHRKAVSSAVRAVALGPRDPANYEQLAAATVSARAATGKTVKVAKTAIELAPESPDGYATLGDVWLSIDKFAKARRAYEQALRIDPTHLHAQHNLGYTLMKQGRLGRSARLFAGVLRESPTSHLARLNIRQTAEQVMTFVLGAVWLLYLFALILDITTNPSTGLVPSVEAAPVLPRVIAVAVIVFAIAAYLWRFHAAAGWSFRALAADMFIGRRLFPLLTIVLAISLLLECLALLVPGFGTTAVFTVILWCLVTSAFLRVLTAVAA